MARSENKLTALVRTQTGKGASRRARREGKIPAVLYGHGAEPQHLELPGHDFAAVLRHSGTNAVLTLDIAGKEQLALTKALTIHPIRRSIVHADLLVVRRGEKVVVEVNVSEMIGSDSNCGIARIRVIVSYPSRPGIMMSIRTRSNELSSSSIRIASSPFSA